jgi:hypothetical protein
MNPHLNSILAQQRIADLQRTAEHARLATDAVTQRRDWRDSNPIVRALPMPTAHPSPEAWPDASLAAGTSPAPASPRARSACCRTNTERSLSTAARMKAAWVALSRDQEARRSQRAPGTVASRVRPWPPG